MTDLIDRYVFTALRRIPQPQRADIDRELRASIEDAVDARVDAGTPREAAVETTLTELGDPGKLADSYANRPNTLIGPELYGVWRRLMILMFGTVLPAVVAVTVVIHLIDDPDPGRVIGAAIGVILTVGVHMAFWTTLAIFLVDRTGAGRDDLNTTWKITDLPRYERRALSKAELATALSWPVMLIAAVVLQQFTFTRVPLLDPAGWSLWWPALIVAFALRGAVAVWIYRTGWTRTTTVASAVAVLLAAVPMIWLLAAGRFFNPMAAGLPSWVTGIAIAAVAVSAGWDIFAAARRALTVR